MIEQQPLYTFFVPRYWGTWIFIGILRISLWLPRRWQYRAGGALGLLGLCFSAKRRRITAINLALCFPELSEQERAGLLRRCFMELGIGYLEAFAAWSGKADRLAGTVDLIGSDLMQEALQEDRGVLLIGLHLTSIEMSGPLVASRWPLTPIYRPQKNKLFNELMKRGRARYERGKYAIERSNSREMLRALRNKHILYVLVDQDHGPRSSVFAPFFGIEAATLRNIGRLAQHCHSPILLLSILRKTDASGHTVQISRIDNIPSGSETEDARCINEALEEIIRQAPEQYLWQHRRFKTRPATEKSFYSTS